MAHQCERDNTGRVQIYVDGCVLDPGSLYAKAGIGVWFGDNHPWNVSEAILGETDNNLAECGAVIKALDIACAQRLLKIRILTYSHMIGDFISGYSETLRGSVAEKLTTVIQRYKNISGDVLIHLVYIHKATRGNNEADKLARRGAQKYHWIRKIPFCKLSRF